LITEKVLKVDPTCVSRSVARVEGRLQKENTSGSSIEARLHTVHVHHEKLGDFELEVGFSLGDIQRELLGRDFFNLAQVGFHEKQLAYYLTPTG
jgi:hypothetical protein